MIFDVDLVYQYNGVFDIHTDQSQQAENGEEVERFAQQQQSQYDADEYQRKHQQDDCRLAIRLEQQQQGGKHQEEGQRQILCQSFVRFHLTLLFTKVFQGVAFRNLDFLLYLRPYLVESCDGVHSPSRVTLRNHHQLPVIVFHV